ncbi:MAG: PKD domain-containing protein, partial [Acidobacteria bacterium]|nr:PKD domain-containing protein [Acidobacteriota bacterium]
MKRLNVKRVFLILLMGMIFTFSGALWSQDLQIHYINVEQGQSILIIGPDGTTVLIDGGNTGKGTSEVIPYLQSKGISAGVGLDYMISTHLDTDHLVGLTEVMNYGYDVAHVYYNGSNKTGTAITDFKNAAFGTSSGGAYAISLGQVINLGSGATARCIATNGSVIGVGAISGGQNNENDRSVALLIKYGNFEYITTGDMGGGSDDGACTGRSTTQINMETPMVNAIMPGGAYPLLSSYGAEVVHIGHHGSESSGNSDYMNLLSPQVACISVGSGQSIGWYHPRIDVVEHVFLSQTACITADPALILQTEEGSPTGSTTSYAGYCVGDIVISTNGLSYYTVSGSGAVTQGPDERNTAGLPATLYFEEGSSTVIANFTGTPTSGAAPLNVSFTNQSMGATSYSWTFSDGGTSTAANPAHTYNAAGTYTVSLTASNGSNSDTETKTGYITVSSVNDDIADAVDITGMTFTKSGNGNWSRVTNVSYSGGDSAKSGTITHSQSCSIETTITVSQTSDVKFYWQVSSESSYDYLKFYIDGIQKNQISGSTTWAQVINSISAGNHTLKWTYSKDAGVSSGSDCGWVDKLEVAAGGVSYCASASTTCTGEWIARVRIGTLDKSSGASNYSDYTSTITNYTRGVSQSVTLTPGFSGTTYTEYWRIFIDYNKDGDLTDSGETVFSKSGSSSVTGSFTPPTSASTGNTRMRVSMKYGAYPTACETFT